MDVEQIVVLINQYVPVILSIITNLVLVILSLKGVVGKLDGIFKASDDKDKKINELTSALTQSIRKVDELTIEVKSLKEDIDTHRIKP